MRSGYETGPSIPGLAALSGSNQRASDTGRPETGADDLLPEWETNEEALEHLAAVSDEIFEEQLNGWYRVPPVWPDERDLNAFVQWFECSFHSMAIGVCAERLQHTDM